MCTGLEAMDLIVLVFVVATVALGVDGIVVSFADGNSALTVDITETGPNSTRISCSSAAKETKLPDIKDGAIIIDRTVMMALEEKCNEQTTTPTSADGRIRRAMVAPGTHWCGADNTADHYNDMGYFHDTDACCRDHDHCGLCISSGETKHNIRNNKIYTICSCECDKKFSLCLKNVGSLVSQTVGSLFFNILQVPCVDINARPPGLSSSSYYSQTTKAPSFIRKIASWFADIFGKK
ncbi:uncharacterized protein LOC131931558 [Physella acuta]|uniref:uncharacterized protein LOC131931558 n=1 Tax=Physella acuta TaxID=109671 RepID=UPI0027DCC869|nr:uncharacterized protein LOC131931558 [Physella acuta]